MPVHRLFLRAAFLSIAAIMGCATPQALNVYTVDAISGHPIAGVRVEHFSTTASQWAGATNEEGRLEGIKIIQGDKLSFEHPQYEPLRVFIDYSGALPLQPAPPTAGDKAAQKADVPVPDADAFPYASDHSVTIVMRPK